MLKFIKEICWKSKCMLLSYFVIFIGVFLVNIMINNFDSITITYYYSVASILMFLEIATDALVDGISIYILQSNKKREVITYIKNGLIICLLLLVFIFGVIFIFRHFIFVDFLKIIVPDNYLFLIIITIAYLISIPTLYFQHILQVLGNFKYNLITRVFFNSIMVITFFGLNIINHDILNIAYAIMIAGILTLGLTFLIFRYQNGKFDFDIKELFSSPIKDFRRSFTTSITLIFQNNLWGACNLLKTVILIKVSIDLFNATSYISNSFFFMEGVFFALIAVINIDISKYLGHNKKEEAYKYSKKAFATIIITQVALGICYLVFGNITLSYINSEFYDIAKSVYMLMLLFYSINIIDWALSYNILERGSKAKLQVILEIVDLVYLITLLIFLSIFQFKNIYLAIILIDLIPIIKIVINLFYFRSKKWLITINEDSQSI